jgi:hypothetical protein
MRGLSEMFIETRHFDSGKAMARLRKFKAELKTSESYDSYIDEVVDLQEWIEDNLSIETDDITDFVIKLDGGKWVDITRFC